MTGAAIAAVLASAAPSGAADSTQPRPGAGASTSYSAALSDREAQAIIDYWTPERMRAADAAATDESPSTGSGDRTSGAPDGPPGSMPPAAAPPGSQRLIEQTPGHHGRPLRLWLERDDWGWKKNWVFVPGYVNGKAPFGKFPARTLRAFIAWIDSQSIAHDIGVATTVANARGQLLGNAVGGEGFAWNQSKHVFVTAFGYPAEFQYNWQTQQSCARWTSRVILRNGIKIKCGFGAGASGGPWLLDHAGTSWGYVNGVFRHFNYRDHITNDSAYFDSKVKTMFDAAAGD